MKHDENKDLRSVARIAKVDYSNKTIQASKTANIGIHMWGKIDYLTKYCNWHFIWNNSVGPIYVQSSDSNSVRAQKKAKKEPKLTDKTKKVKKK